MAFTVAMTFTTFDRIEVNRVVDKVAFEEGTLRSTPR